MQDILTKRKIKIDYKTILSMWNESHRHHHSQSHLSDLFDQINEIRSTITEFEYDALMTCAMFHDIILDPKRIDNEEESNKFFKSCCTEQNEFTNLVSSMILDTKNHKPSSKISEKFSSMDMKICERSYDDLLQWENGIFEEYKVHGVEEYKRGRLAFLNSVLDKYVQNTENLLKLVEYVKSTY